MILLNTSLCEVHAPSNGAGQLDCTNLETCFRSLPLRMAFRIRSPEKSDDGCEWPRGPSKGLGEPEYPYRQGFDVRFSLAYSLWRDGKLEGEVVNLEGNIETVGAKLAVPAALLWIVGNFLQWSPIPPKTAKKLAEVCARLCRLLRDEVVEQMALGDSGLTGLAQDWHMLLFPQANDEQFADGYAQAVTFGLLVARSRDIGLSGRIDHAAQELRKFVDRNRAEAAD